LWVRVREWGDNHRTCSRLWLLPLAGTATSTAGATPTTAQNNNNDDHDKCDHSYNDSYDHSGAQVTANATARRIVPGNRASAIVVVRTSGSEDSIT
jgi:hypothetical protein